MIRSGDTLENTVTGERLNFRRTAADTDGAAVLVETTVRSGGFVAAAHVHPYQTERFEVLSGTLGISLGGETMTARPGEKLTIEPGTAHRFWNAGENDLRFLAEITPALEFESLIETMFGLAAAGKTNSRGLPNPLRLAVIAKAHFDTVRLPYPPAALQRLGLTLGAPLGRALGYEPTYAPASG